jgi:aryl-alcohol dehydrogenase-like predicted oxidoreductase
MTGGVAECIRALEIGGYETVQFPYNMLTLAAEERLFPLIREKYAGAIIMRGLAGGKLTSKYRNLKNRELADAIRGFEQFADEDGLASLATRFVLARPEVSSVILGTRRLEAVDENLTAALRPLAPETAEAIREYARGLPVGAW